MARLAAPAFAVIAALAVGQALWHAAQLPDTVASHFDSTGRANGWTPRSTHTLLHLSLIVSIIGLLEGIARLSRRLPDEYINIPHRDYWLAPERREETLSWLTAMMRGVGCVTLLFFIGLFHQVYLANVAAGPRTISTALLAIGLLLAIAAVSLACLLRFRRPPNLS